ncbi:MAG: tRNA (adenosine(37)-N6)-threonylcarbamoyltransferase complex transferase subunit TsaD [Eggerthellaceae bacterium]|nr:tRNA (adenosine(37)-N6)-threonylcarbamoyltransferase complex transferase subunit TsaD [Eggerthellaceae bacterium]
MNQNSTRDIVVSFDTANEYIALGIGTLDASTHTITCLDTVEVAAHRASNTKLLPTLDACLKRNAIEHDRIACVVCGRGPGSFTGVRICIATAKGMASALEVPLIGVSTLDAIAWYLWNNNTRGQALVLADAMRHEVYPVSYRLTDEGITRLDTDIVRGVQDEADHLAEGSSLIIAGDALKKYGELFAPFGTFAPDTLWMPHGEGLLLAAQAAWRDGTADPFDTLRHDPAFLLPIYTRLSDAEEHERTRLAQPSPRDLRSGVQLQGTHQDACADSEQLIFRPLSASSGDSVAALETELMGSDAWNQQMICDELPRKDRTWWAAYDGSSQHLIAYAGGWIVDGQMQLLKIACVPAWRRQGIARTLLGRIASDARDLGASTMTLEVRRSNEGARAFYTALGCEFQGYRPGYYSDGEDAAIMSGPLPVDDHDVAGMELLFDCGGEQGAEDPHRPLVLAIESSCDETAAAIIDGDGDLLSDTVASQIDFHARFGGVVPEIASRKHIEAICGVTQVCLERAATRLKRSSLRWRDLDAVAVTYTPGLVGALVVGVAFAKAAAWACEIPVIGVNHLEGHLFANKIAQPGIEPPLVASLVSGGHTMLVYVREWGSYEVLGSTLDDAVGEAFDKVAKALGLGYPGGPIISQLAAQGNPKAIHFPRAMMHSGDYSFSLSGLKTAVISYIHQTEQKGEDLCLPDIAASFQAAVIDVQVSKAAHAIEQTHVNEFCLGGGVAANPALRAAYERMCKSRGVRLTLPPVSACTDNAAMIALVGLDRYRQQRYASLDLDAQAHCDLSDPY